MAWAPAYITAEEAAAFITLTDDDDDAELEFVVEAASRAIDSFCNRQFGKVAAPEARTYEAFYDCVQGTWAIDIDDLMTTTGLEVTVDGDAVTDYSLTPANALQKGRPWTRLVVDRGSSVTPYAGALDVSVTASWGWSAVPVAVQYACRLQVNRFHSRRQAPFGVAGSPDSGTELRLLTKVDPDVAVSLKSYVRRRAVG